MRQQGLITPSSSSSSGGLSSSNYFSSSTNSMRAANDNYPAYSSSYTANSYAPTYQPLNNFYQPSSAAPSSSVYAGLYHENAFGKPNYNLFPQDNLLQPLGSLSNTGFNNQANDIFANSAKGLDSISKFFADFTAENEKRIQEERERSYAASRQSLSVMIDDLSVERQSQVNKMFQRSEEDGRQFKFFSEQVKNEREAEYYRRSFLSEIDDQKWENSFSGHSEHMQKFREQVELAKKSGIEFNFLDFFPALYVEENRLYQLKKEAYKQQVSFLLSNLYRVAKSLNLPIDQEYIRKVMKIKCILLESALQNGLILDVLIDRAKTYHNWLSPRSELLRFPSQCCEFMVDAYDADYIGVWGQDAATLSEQKKSHDLSANIRSLLLKVYTKLLEDNRSIDHEYVRHVLTHASPVVIESALESGFVLETMFMRSPFYEQFKAKRAAAREKAAKLENVAGSGGGNWNNGTGTDSGSKWSQWYNTVDADFDPRTCLYKESPAHTGGNKHKSRVPTDGQKNLPNSYRFSESGRVSVDLDNTEIIIYRRESANVYHGYVVKPEVLRSRETRAHALLRELKMVDKNGEIK